MNQKTHAWIAVRAVGLLEEAGAAEGLVALLKRNVRKAAIGSWIPDLTDAKRAGAQTQHHVLKLLPYTGPGEKRFVANRAELLGRMAGSPAAKDYLVRDQTLTSAWWERPYKADPPPGKHLADRAMGLSTTLKDLLVLGDPMVDKLLPGRVSFLEKMESTARTKAAQAATYFFMASHFVADACMPCHCDGRKLAGYSCGLHEELEKHWSEGVRNTFVEKNLVNSDKPIKPDELLEEARQVDARFDLRFARSVPAMPKGRDAWLEVVDACRASFAVSSIIVPEADCAYDNESARRPFEEVFGGTEGERLLGEIDRVALHDAVVNTAMLWMDVWASVSRPDN